MAAKDDNEENGESQLTPEERIAKLEKGKKLSTILVFVLLFFSVLQFAGLGVLFVLSGKDPKTQENTVLLATLDAKVLELQKQDNKANQIMLQNEILETKLDKIIAEANIHNYATLRSSMIDQEINNMRFLEALQRGMYELSRMVRGSRTWYEVYKEELDLLIASSEARIAKIEGQGPKVPERVDP